MEIYIQQVVLSVPNLSCVLTVVQNNVFLFNFSSRYVQLYHRSYFYFFYLELNLKKKKALKEKRLFKGGRGRQLCQFMLRLVELVYSGCR